MVFIYFNQCIIMGWVYRQARVLSLILKAKGVGMRRSKEEKVSLKRSEFKV